MRPEVGVRDGFRGDGATAGGHAYCGVHQSAFGPPTDRSTHALTGVGTQDHARIDAGLVGGIVRVVGDP